MSARPHISASHPQYVWMFCAAMEHISSHVNLSSTAEPLLAWVTVYHLKGNICGCTVQRTLGF